MVKKLFFLSISLLSLICFGDISANTNQIKKDVKKSSSFNRKSGKETYKYQLAVCTIFRNEARFLKEWIEYHRLIGVQHFYLYNNLSTDDYKSVLEPYVRSGVVELIQWPYESKGGSDWTPIQCGAYKNALDRANKVKVKWMAVLDTDEFIVTSQEDSLLTFLKDYDKFGGLSIHWQMFGTSGVKKVPDDKLMIEMLTMKAPVGHGEHAFVKTIFHPSRVKNIKDPHKPEYKGHYDSVDENFQHTQNSIVHPISVNKIRINHYWSRDEEFFFQVKCPRRQKWAEGFDGQLARLNAINQVQDPVILRFVPGLRKKMGLP